jgi:hypothetical protein
VVAAIGAALASKWPMMLVYCGVSVPVWSLAYGWPLYRNSLHDSKARRYLESLVWVLILVSWTWVVAGHFVAQNTVAPGAVSENWTSNQGYHSIAPTGVPDDAMFVLGASCACGVMCGLASLFLSSRPPGSFVFPIVVGVAFPFGGVALLMLAPILADVLAYGQNPIGDTIMVLGGLGGGAIIAGALSGALIEFGRRRLLSDHEEEVVNAS